MELIEENIRSIMDLINMFKVDGTIMDYVTVFCVVIVIVTLLGSGIKQMFYRFGSSGGGNALGGGMTRNVIFGFLYCLVFILPIIGLITVVKAKSLLVLDEYFVIMNNLGLLVFLSLAFLFGSYFIVLALRKASRLIRIFINVTVLWLLVTFLVSAGSMEFNNMILFWALVIEGTFLMINSVLKRSEQSIVPDSARKLFISDKTYYLYWNLYSDTPWAILFVMTLFIELIFSEVIGWFYFVGLTYVLYFFGLKEFGAVTSFYEVLENLGVDSIKILFHEQLFDNLIVIFIGAALKYFALKPMKRMII